MRAIRIAASLVTTRRLLGSALAALAVSATAEAQVIEYYGLDAVGSVRVVFDQTGAIVSRMDYGPFGEALAPAGGSQKNVFAGLFREGEAGLDYAQARMYQPRTGRFSTVDPVYAGLFEPQRWNRYAYALNSPITYVDATGSNAENQCPTDHYCETVEVRQAARERMIDMLKRHEIQVLRRAGQSNRRGAARRRRASHRSTRRH